MKYIKYSQTLVLKSFGALLALGLTVILNKVLDEKSFGIYSYITSVTTFFSTIILFGNAKYIMAELPKTTKLYFFNERLTAIKTINISIFIVLSLAISVLYFMGINFFNNMEMIFIGIIMIISYYLSRNKINMSILRASNYPILSEIPELILKPLLLIIFIYLLNLNSVEQILSFLLITLLTTYLIGTFLINKNVGPIFLNFFKISLKFNFISKSLIVFFIALVTILKENIIIYTMPYFLNFEFIGYFKIFSHLALLLSFGMMAVNIPQAYIISKKILTEKSDVKKHLITGLIFSLFYYIILSIVYLLFGEKIIEVLFGPQLIQYMDLFYLMMIGQLIYILIGPMGQVLILSKNYSYALKSLILSFILTFLASIVLIYFYGFKGACYAYILNLFIVHFSFAAYSYKKLNIKPSIFYLLNNADKKQ